MSRSDHAASVGSQEINTAVARRFGEDVWGHGDLDAADAVLAEHFIEHNPMPGQAAGREGHKQVLKLWRQAVPDLTLRVDDVFTAGDRAALRWTARGSHTGAALMGIPPTSRQVTLTGIDILRVVDGKITERWGEFNGIELLQQLGVLPPADGVR
jgi:steroid delta-isomerase-like uncharacterized protein